MSVISLEDALKCKLEYKVAKTNLVKYTNFIFLDLAVLVY